MKLLNDHYIVELKTEHPVWGNLTIDRFQRPKDVCKYIAEKGIITYQGMDVPVKCVVAGNDKWPIYIFFVEWEWRP